MAGPHAGLASLVDSNIRGMEAAKRSLEVIQSGAAVPDELLHSFTQAMKNWGEAGARGWARQIQKALEQATL